MQIDKAKTAAVIIIVLMMASVTLMALPVSAQEDFPHGGQYVGYVGPTTVPSDAPADTLQVETHPYLSVTPNPTGINQYVLVNMWITPPPSNQRFLARFTVDVTKPDGSTDSIGPVNSYLADGTSWAEYTVDQVGTWEFVFKFPGEYFPAGRYISGELNTTATSGGVVYPAMYYQPATSVVTSITVLAEQVFSWPPSPLPTDYWTRPISPQNREWYEIAGPYPWPYMNWCQDWLGPWISAPTSSHIVWSRANLLGGIIGGDLFKDTVTTAPGYPTVIYAGRGYQTWNKPGVGSVAACYDIRTGEVYYEIPTAEGGVAPAIVAFYPPGVSSLGAETSGRYELIAGTVPGSSSGHRLTTSRLMKIDPFTGLVTTNVTGMVGDFYNGHFVLSVQNLGTQVPIDQRYRLINWTTEGNSDNFASRIISNVSTVMTSVPQLVDWNLGVGASVGRFGSGLIFGGNPVMYSLTTGQVLWNITTGIETPFGGGGQGAATMDYGKIAICFEGRRWFCYDALSGRLLWQTEQNEYPWGEFWSYSAASWNGLLYTNSYAGVIAYDWDTGEEVWRTKVYAVPYETPYNGEYSFHSASIVADGKFYTYTTEHTVTQPVTRGWVWLCLNATTGEKLWDLQGFNSDSRNFGGSAAEGYFFASDQNSGTMWAIGKGKSATTVMAPDVSVPLGTAFTIKGTVMDLSPAQPNTPCVSKDSMRTQMEFLHMGMPCAGIWGNETITGVPVVLTAISADGTVHDLGSVTSNGYYGTFGMSWAPPAEGTYEIIASFAGDDSYGSSAASTMVTVGPAPEVPSDGDGGAGTAPDNTMLLYGILVAIIIAIVIGLVAVLLALRKR